MNFLVRLFLLVLIFQVYLWSIILYLLPLKLLRLSIYLIRIISLEFFLPYQILTVFNQPTPDTSVQSTLLDLIELVEHKSQMWTFERPYCFWYCLLKILIEFAITHKAKLSEAVVKDSTVLWIHNFKVRLKLLLEGFNHFFVHKITLCVGIENLAKFNRLVLVNVSHDCWP